MQELIGHGDVRHVDGHVQAGRRLLAIEVPAGLRQLIADGVDVKTLGADREDAHVWSAQHMQAGHGVNGFFQFIGCRQHLGCQVHVAGFAQVVHDSPRRGDGAAGARAGHGGRRVDAARPTGLHKELAATQVRAAVEDHRGSFGRVTVLVQVHGKRGDARHAEIERRDGIAQPAGEGQHHAAHARVHVQQHAAGLRSLRQRCDGINHALRIRGGRTDQENGVRGDGRGHGCYVGAEVICHRDMNWPHAEVMAGVVQRGMRGDRQHHLRCADGWPLDARPVACRLDG